MSDTQNEKFESDFEDNKDSSAAEPVTDGQSLVTPDHTDVPEDDSAEPADAETQHKATAEDVDKAGESESSA